MPTHRRADALHASDLERAATGFERAIETLATHPGLLPARLSAAALAISEACPWNRSPRLPRDLPDGMRPPQDLPGDLEERMRVLLHGIAGRSLEDGEATNAARELVDLADALIAADRQMRRTKAILVLTTTPEELQRERTDAELLRSGVWSEEHLITLGRIVEESASNEAMARRLLGLALKLPDGDFARQRYADALFLGSRVRDLAAKLAALASLDGMSTWLPEAIDWAGSAKNADERRNQLLHRPPVFVMGAAGPQPGVSPARKSQEPEVLEAQALSVLRELDAVSRGGSLLLIRINADKASSQ